MRLIEISDFKKIRASTQRLHFILSLYSHLYGSTRQMVTTARRLKERLFIGRKAMTNLDSMLKSRDIILLTKVWLAKAMVFPVVIYGCKSWTDHKEDWAPKNWCFQTVVLEKTVESPLDYKIKPVNPKGNQPQIFIGRTDTEARILWPPDGKSQLIGKDPNDRKDWRQKEKKVTGWAG